MNLTILAQTGIQVPDINRIPINDWGIAEWLYVGIVVGIIALIYMLPTVIAMATKHPAVIGIGALNLVLGWTVLIWGALFIWACIKPGKPVTVIQQYPMTSPPPLPTRPRLETELEELLRLKEKTLINEQEFQERRKQLLGRL